MDPNVWPFASETFTPRLVATLKYGSENENQYWFFSNPYTLTDNNPYKKNDTVFNKLENGKIYRIINEGVKDVKNTNTYLTINDLNYEILVPNDKNILTNNLKNDTSLWKCVILISIN